MRRGRPAHGAVGRDPWAGCMWGVGVRPWGPWGHEKGKSGASGAIKASGGGGSPWAMRRAVREARAWCHRKRRVYVGVGVGLGGWESGWGWGGVRADGAMDGVGGQQGQIMQPWGHEPLRP